MFTLITSLIVLFCSLSKINSKKNHTKKGRLFTQFLKSPPSTINIKCPDCIWYKEYKIKNKHIQNYGHCYKYNSLAIYATENNDLCGKNMTSFSQQYTPNYWQILFDDCVQLF